MPGYDLHLEEGERQGVLLALQKLRVERPGWDYFLGTIEARLGGQIGWPPYDGDPPLLPLQTIFVERRAADYHATLDAAGKIRGSGPTAEAAVGDLIRTWPNCCGLRVKEKSGEVL